MSDDKYARAGVNIDQGNQAVQKIRDMVNKYGVKEIGKFSGFFPLKKSLNQPVLVSSADGVGTKLKIAFMSGIHHTVGHDLVNHCVNDILVYGAQPLFFLDYIAMGKVVPDTVAQIVKGMLEGCLENGFILLGGETAEMPGFYQEKEYDIAGFIVGIIEKQKITDGKNIKPGDVLIGLPSTGLHTNGYSLARHIVFEQLKLTVDSMVDGLDQPIGQALLATHRSYLKPVNELLKKNHLKGMAHITGGGFIDNIPRILPENTAVKIVRNWPELPIFKFLCEAGKVSFMERYRVFNMGIGMVLIADPRHLSQIESELQKIDEKCYVMGQVIPKTDEVSVFID